MFNKISIIWLRVKEGHQKTLLWCVVAGLLMSWALGGCINVDSYIFQPPGASYGDGKDVIKLESEAGVEISATYLHNEKAKYTVLFSHGNAEDLGDILSVLKAYQKSGFSVFAYDYRGYGTSQGVPSEVNTYKDVEAAYTYLVERLHKDPNEIIVHGRSLGSGPSTHIAATRRVGGLILESGFASVYRVVSDNYSESVAAVDPFNNLEKIKAVKYPVLIIHGKDDLIIPFKHGQQMYEAAGTPKMNYWVEKAGHNNLVQVAKNNYWKKLKAFSVFIDRIVLEENHQDKNGL